MFGGFLTDVQIAAVVNCVCTHFANCDPDEVTVIRDHVNP